MADLVTLQEVYELTDFALNNMWQMSFIQMPNVPGVSMTSAQLNMRCQSFTVPQSTVQYIDVTLHNHVKHQPARTVQPVDITIPFVETKDMKTTKWFTGWRDICCKTNTNYVSDPAQRRATIQFYHYGNQQEIIYTYKIAYAEVEEIGNIDYGDGSSPAAVIKQVKLKVGAVYNGNGTGTN